MKESCSCYITQKKIEILIKIYQYLKNRMCLVKWKNSGMKRIEFERRKCEAFNRWRFQRLGMFDKIRRKQELRGRDVTEWECSVWVSRRGNLEKWNGRKFEKLKVLIPKASKI